jgi:hypothetical protein
MWAAGGAAGVVLALAGGVLGWSLLETSTGAALRSLELTADVLDTVDETAGVIDATFTSTVEGLRAAESSMADVAATLTDVAAVAGDLTGLVADDLAGRLDAALVTMPPLVDAARVIDRSMRALSFFGVDYDVEVPLDRSLEQLRRELAPLPAELRRQAHAMEGVAGDLAGFGSTSLRLAGDLGAVRARLEESGGMVERYRSAAERVAGLVAELEEEIASQRRWGRFVLVGLAMAVAAGQTLPLSAGLTALRRKPD